MPLNFYFLEVDVGQTGEKKVGRKMLFTQAIPLLGISVNPLKSQKNHRIIEVS